MKWKFSIFLCLLFLGISLNTAFASNDFIVPMDYNATAKVSESFYIKNFSEIANITVFEGFKNWTAKYTNVDPNNFDLELVNPNTNKTNVIMFYNGTHKAYYSIATGKDSDMKIKGINDGNSNLVYSKSNTNQNYFKIVNKAGRTAYDIRVILYRFVWGIPIQIHSIQRYNLPNNRVLNYNPSPEFTHVTIAINVEKKWVIDPRVDIYHLMIPLKTWHTATIQKGRGYYLYFT